MRFKNSHCAFYLFFTYAVKFLSEFQKMISNLCCYLLITSLFQSYKVVY